MTRDQDHAAFHARKAALRYLRSTTDKRDTISAYWDEQRAYVREYGPNLSNEKAWHAAWHTTLETT